MDEKKQELNDFLLSLARKYGLSVSELKNLAAEVAEKLENKCNKPKIKVGWYAFECGKFSENPKAYPNCQGVVAYLNSDPNAPTGQRGLILTPDEELYPYADGYYCAGSVDENDGKFNTIKMLLYNRNCNTVFCSAVWCSAHPRKGVRDGEAFFPAKNQLKKVIANRRIINPALKRINGDIIDGLYISSTEYNEFNVWGMDTKRDQPECLFDKMEFLCLRSVIAF